MNKAMSLCELIGGNLIEGSGDEGISFVQPLAGLDGVVEMKKLLILVQKVMFRK